MIRQCCQCKKIEVGGQWVSPASNQLNNQDVSHGYCNDCFAICKKKLHEHLTHATQSGRRSLPRYF